LLLAWIIKGGFKSLAMVDVGRAFSMNTGAGWRDLRHMGFYKPE